MSEQPIGVMVDYRFVNDTHTLEGYVSFGEYDEDTDQDSYGIPDEYIFYYCESLQELESLLGKDVDGFTMIRITDKAYELEENK